MCSLYVLSSLVLQLRVLTLSQAIVAAEQHHPQAKQARAESQSAETRVDQARAPFLPQLNAQASYQRSTANYGSQAGPARSSVFGTTGSSFDTYNYFNGSLVLNQWLFDFGQTVGKYHSAQASLSSTQATEKATRTQLYLKVRQTYFQARAQKALLQVAKEALANQMRHQAQIEGFVQVGTRPAIDLAQVRTDVANARLQAITAENNYRTAKAQLVAAIGSTDAGDFDVSDDTLPPINGEDQASFVLVKRALEARAEIKSVDHQLRSQEDVLRATRGAYWPTLGLALSLSEAGSQLDQLAWNFSAAINLNWPLFQGGLTHARVRETQYAMEALRAQSEGLKQQTTLEVTQAHLSVRAAKAALTAGEQALENARERLRLAEGRYATGVGNGIELGDAQIKLTDAAAQQVIAAFNLASARAQLLAALGLER